MLAIHRIRFLIWLLVVGMLVGCSPTPATVVEVTRIVPQTVVVTVIVPQTVLPTQLPETPTPSITPTLDPDAPLPTWTPDPRVWYPLLNCPPSRLHVGDTAMVSLVGGPNAIRSTSEVDIGNAFMYAQPGQTMEIIAGPECSWNWIVWKVRLPDSNEGWTPEGDGKTWWLEPVTP